MRIEIASTTHGALTWDLPQNLAQKLEGLAKEDQEAIKSGITKMLNEYFLFLTTALGGKKNVPEEVEKVWQMQRLLMTEILKGTITFIPRDQLGSSH